MYEASYHSLLDQKDLTKQDRSYVATIVQTAATLTRSLEEQAPTVGA
jgi:hypothetical protein